MIGTKLAHFHITAHLGSGGMGDVYEASDSKLGRSVAIKLLPEAFARDSERVARFEREARVLASLNHPNIAAIYGLEGIDGRMFLVMEHVPGETLAERIYKGRIPVDEALGIAKQICEALEAAHEKSIVHRDLKPANVKITPEGRVKVLDFGLAKAYQQDTSATDSSNSPTLLSAASMPGVILGTAAYMSPEQAKGKEVDKRTDIFAFGCVLFEMLTGKAVFAGGTTAEIIAAVIEREPSWKFLPLDTPPSIRPMLRRCLAKSPADRLHDVADVRIQVQDALGPSDLSSVSVSLIRSRVVPVLLTLFLIAAAISAGIWYRSWNSRTQSGAYRFDILMPPGTALQTGIYAAPTPALSPDGRLLSFSAIVNGKTSIFIRKLDSTDARMIEGTEGGGQGFQFWSPDSQYLGFFAGGKLKKVALSGGAAEVLCDAPVGQSGDWNSEGTIIFESNHGLQKISSAGGIPATVMSPDTKQHETNFKWVQFLPDGKHFLFLVLNSNPSSNQIRVGSLDNTSAAAVMTLTSMAIYAPPGYLLFLRNGSLEAQHLNLATFKLTGEPLVLAENLPQNPTLGSAPVSVSQRAIVYRSGAAAATDLTWFSREGKVLGTESVDPVVLSPAPTLSPDEKHIAFVGYSPAGIWVKDLVRGTSTRLTVDAAADASYPVWSADGNSIVFARNTQASSAAGDSQLYRKAANGTGSEEALHIFAAGPNQWTSDGSLIFTTQSPQGTQDTCIASIAAEPRPACILKEKYSQKFAMMSPDEKFIAYSSDETGRFEIYVQTVPVGGGRWQISTAGGQYPRWTSGGREITFVTGDGRVMAVQITSLPSFQAGVPKQLFQVQNGTLIGRYAVTADGQRFLFAVPKEASAPPMTVLLNWTALLDSKK